MLKRILKKIYKIFFKETPTEKFNREEQENYQKWIKNNEPDENELKRQRNEKFEINPKISIVIPLYRTPENYFNELVNSIKEQTYSNWEICFADGSEKKEKYLDKILELYPDKIKYKFIGENKGISGNTNEALKLATGDFIALVDHDDLLPKFSLYEIVKAINNEPEADFVYSDEDKFIRKNEINIRMLPHFKQDYALDTLRSYNYICHFTVIKKELIDKIGNFRSEYDGSQDYDIILRATENANKIVHISKILYHWRINENSVASGASAKPYAYNAAKRAIKSSLERNDIFNAIVEDSKIIGIYKIKYPIIKEDKISIIIVNRNNLKELKRCIGSIMKSTYKNYEIIIVDNNSNENSLKKYYKKISKDDRIRVEFIKDDNWNLSKLNNFGVKKATGDYFVFLNNNIQILSNNWLEIILSNCQRNEVGCIGAKLIYKNKRIKHAGMTIGLNGFVGYLNSNEKSKSPGYFGRIMIQQNVMAVSGELLGISKEVFYKVNGFDEKLSCEFNNIDLCLKLIDIGKSVIYNPYVVAYSYSDLQDNFEDFNLQEKIIKERWNNYFENEDRYFNKNFLKNVSNMRINPNKT